MRKLVLDVLKLTYVGIKHEWNRLKDATSIKLPRTQHTYCKSSFERTPNTCSRGLDQCSFHNPRCGTRRRVAALANFSTGKVLLKASHLWSFCLYLKLRYVSDFLEIVFLGIKMYNYSTIIIENKTSFISTASWKINTKKVGRMLCLVMCPIKVAARYAKNVGLTKHLLDTNINNSLSSTWLKYTILNCEFYIYPLNTYIYVINL